MNRRARKVRLDSLVYRGLDFDQVLFTYLDD